MPVDKKYTGVITKADGSVVDDWIVFRAKDKLILYALASYLGACMAEGCSGEHITGIQQLIRRVKVFQAKHPDVVKLPDTKVSDWILDVSEKVGG
jgi:hypothetical protein